MLNKWFLGLIAVGTMSSCAAFKPTAVNTADRKTYPSNSNVTFINNIVVAPEGSTVQHTSRKTTSSGKTSAAGVGNLSTLYDARATTSSLEAASALVFKYAILLETEVENALNIHLLDYVDEWYGTRYRYGGTTKAGIDCSAFVQNVFKTAYEKAMPRTAREQYQAARKISTTELKEGDLVFFNTTGGVSHVGIYLTNNKFIHASRSQGVVVSDLFENYYMKRFIGAGRVDNK